MSFGLNAKSFFLVTKHFTFLFGEFPSHVRIFFFGVVSADVIGAVQSVLQVLSIRNKRNNEEILKRDITIADERRGLLLFSSLLMLTKIELI